MPRTEKFDSLVEIITSEEDVIRNRSLDNVCADASLEALQEHCVALDRFWRQADNLYQRVRALLFLSAIHQYHLPQHFGNQHRGNIPQAAWQHLLERRFTEAIDLLLDAEAENGPSDGLSSALAKGYHELGFQSLADQVRQSVRTVRGNQWMFRTGHPTDHPLRFRKELLPKENQAAASPILKETTSVRMDFTHSAWSDIFFLGMDFPAGAKVINASVDLGVMGRDDRPQPPIECYLRVIDQPVLKLTSTDLNASAEITTIAEVFDFAKDYLGLLKAAVIASGIVPPGMEGCGQNMDRLMERLIGPGLGLEIVSKVNDIPKGSRLAVSTNLLGSLISLCMRATGQIGALVGGLEEADRRIVAARAILGEWIGGSGGGWQDSGGVWPGIKLICGSEAAEGDPEFGASRGRLLPQHSVFSSEEVSPETRQALQDSLVLVHGGMAQNVGPILEMVTEKYLLRSPAEWEARQEAIEILDEITLGLREGDIRAIGKATHRNFFGPLQKIIPWCTNLFTNSLIEQSQEKWGEQFWGFWMLGGMAGGGMGFIFDPTVKAEAAKWLQETMLATKNRMQNRLPFAMDPVVYDFKINDRGSWSKLLGGDQARMPAEYYALQVPGWLKRESHELSSLARRELEQLGSQFRNNGDAQTLQKLVASILPSPPASEKKQETLEELMERLGFDREMHERIQTDLQSGRFGLAQNRLPLNTSIRDVEPEDVIDLRNEIDPAAVAAGKQSIANGEVAVVTLAAGIGSRWTGGAGVVKGLHPFAQFSGQHRSFLEVHLAKSRRISQRFASPECAIPHIFTTGYMTHAPIEQHLDAAGNYRYRGMVRLSPGRYVGLRTIPMIRDLHFTWQETQQQVLDEQQQKVRSSARTALLKWAQQMGPGSDYTDNLPMQCLHPVGHWYEVPNLLRNGTLRDLLDQRPQLQYLMLHNIDTLGANVDPGILGTHIEHGNCFSVEVIQRRLDDRGGGLARVNGYPRLVEGLALPREEDEFKLTYYNSLTTWINIDHLLKLMGLSREDLEDQEKVERCVRQLAEQMPTYITLKDVKKRWGNGQEDVFPVAQSEKLWGDMTALADVSCDFFVIPLPRGQQLKEQAQLDGWLRDGSADYVNRLCDWG